MTTYLAPSVTVGDRVRNPYSDTPAAVGTVTYMHDVPLRNWATGEVEGSYPCAAVLFDGAPCERHLNAHYLTRVQG